MLSQRLAFILLAIAIASALFLRVPHMNNEVKSWQVGMTQMLTTLEIWHEEGCSNHYFSPVQTWPNPGDKFKHLYKRLEDKRGNNYYVSLPPMSWWMAHGVFFITGRPPTQIDLQICGFVLQLIGAFSIFGLLFALTASRLGSLVGFTIFLFYPVLTFGYNFYFFSEIIGLTFWALTGYLAVLTVSKNSRKWKWVLALTNLLFVLTCWSGVFFGFSVTLLFLRLRRWKPMALILLSTIVGLSIIVATYGSVSGIDDLIHAWKIRFMERSGMYEQHLSDQGLNFANPESYQLLLARAMEQLKWIGYACITVMTLAVLWRIFGRWNKMSERNLSLRLMVFIMLIPALLHLMVFLNANALHFVYQGKWALLLAVFTGWTVYRLELLSNNTPLLPSLGILSTGLLLSLKMYTPEDKETNRHHQIAKQLRPQLDPNQPVYLPNGTYANTIYISYLLKRNVLPFEEEN